LEWGRGEEITVSQELQLLATAKLPQILITLEPELVASTLLQMFNRQQVSQLVQLLQMRRWHLRWCKKVGDSQENKLNVFNFGELGRYVINCAPTEVAIILEGELG